MDESVDQPLLGRVGCCRYGLALQALGALAELAEDDLERSAHRAVAQLKGSSAAPDELDDPICLVSEFSQAGRGR